MAVLMRLSLFVLPVDCPDPSQAVHHPESTLLSPNVTNWLKLCATDGWGPARIAAPANNAALSLGLIRLLLWSRRQLRRCPPKTRTELSLKVSKPRRWRFPRKGELSPMR